MPPDATSATLPHAQAIPATLEPLAVPVAALVPYSRNPRRGDVDLLKESLRTNGQYRPLVVREETGEVLAGNHTLAAAQALGWERIAVTYVSCNDEQAARIVLVDNRASDAATNDSQVLVALLAEVEETEQGLLGTGYGLGDVEALAALAGDWDAAERAALLQQQPGVLLRDRFGTPPFSVLDARSGPWLKRKREWLSLGIRSELGRGDGAYIYGNQERLNDIMRKRQRQPGSGLLLPTAVRDPDFYRKMQAAEAAGGQALTAQEFLDSGRYAPPATDTGLYSTGTSVFDPVVCEIAYHWFSPPDGHVLDPFAGGSVRGVVAAAMGRRYTGIELLPAQVEANRAQAEEILPRLPEGAPPPTWIQGDSRTADVLLPQAARYDLVLSCPPYADLEVYSDDPADLSTMAWPDFCAAYREIIQTAVARLRDNRFIVWVVGEVRGPGGEYYGLIPETIAAFAAAGCAYHNEMILVQPIGSLAVRIGRQFPPARRIGKTHQQVLVFVKGDPKVAAAACGPIEVTMPLDAEALDADEVTG